MKQDEIIEMAKEAGLIVNSPYLMPHDNVMQGIEAFAKLVAAKEREACANVCDALFDSSRPVSDESGDWVLGTTDCASAIRTRGEE